MLQLRVTLDQCVNDATVHVLNVGLTLANLLGVGVALTLDPVNHLQGHSADLDIVADQLGVWLHEVVVPVFTIFLGGLVCCELFCIVATNKRLELAEFYHSICDVVRCVTCVLSHCEADREVSAGQDFPAVDSCKQLGQITLGPGLRVVEHLELITESLLVATRFSDQPLTDESRLQEKREGKSSIDSVNLRLINLHIHLRQHDFTATLVGDQGVQEHVGVNVVDRLQVHSQAQCDRPVITTVLILDGSVLVYVHLALGIALIKDSIGVGWALILLVHVNLVVEVIKLVRRHELDLWLMVVRVVAFQLLNKQLVIHVDHGCGVLDFVYVLIVGAQETRVQVTYDEVEVTEAVCLGPVGAPCDLRVDLLENFSHHVEPVLLRERTVGQMAVDEAEGVFM